MLPQGWDRLHLTSVAGSGTILPVGPLGKATFSRSKCACSLTKAACLLSLFLMLGVAGHICPGRLQGYCVSILGW